MKRSAGLLLYRQQGDEVLVLLVHPGGPYWAKKDLGAWSIPKGLIDPDEEPLAAARRELWEETGLETEGPFLDLSSVRQKGGKVVQAWAAPLPDGCDPATLVCSTEVEVVWPPRSGRRQRFPEVDRAGVFPLTAARERINPAQVAFLDALEERLEVPRADRRPTMGNGL